MVFFDTDGSVYKLRYGIQIAFSNRSLPLLISLRSMLIDLKYKPSHIVSNRVYLTKKTDLKRFFEEIKPHNRKHTERFKKFKKILVTRR